MCQITAKATASPIPIAVSVCRERLDIGVLLTRTDWNAATIHAADWRLTGSQRGRRPHSCFAEGRRWWSGGVVRRGQRSLVDLLDGVGRHDQVAVVRLERWLRARGYDDEADRVA